MVLSVTLVFLPEPIPTTLYDVLNVGVDGDEIEIIPLNYPMKTPLNVTHQLSLVTHHGYHIRFESRKLQLCKQSSGVVNMRAELRDVFNSEMLLDLCTDSTRSNFSYESVFHTFTLTYQQINRQPAFILGTVRAVKGRPLNGFLLFIGLPFYSRFTLLQTTIT